MEASVKRAVGRATRMKMRRGVDSAVLAAYMALARRLIVRAALRAKRDGQRRITSAHIGAALNDVLPARALRKL